MRVLESPITWIVVAVVLLAIALLLIVVSVARRRRARRAAAAAAWPPPALESGRADPEAVWSEPAPDAREATPTRTPVSNLPEAPASTAAASYAEPRTDPLDADAVRAGLAAAPLFRPVSASLAAQDAEETPSGDHRPRHAAATDDAEVTEDTGDAAEDTTDTIGSSPEPTAPAAEDTGIVEPVTDRPGTEDAKDRLLAVLLRDPQAAVAALAAAGGGDGAGPGERDVTALLRAGLSPAQVARLVGIDEERLATVVARGLGLLPGDQAPTTENRTDDPGRSWANAASSAGSTTPTTG